MNNKQLRDKLSLNNFTKRYRTLVDFFYASINCINTVVNIFMKIYTYMYFNYIFCIYFFMNLFKL
jgi:hypothetical protein